MTDFTARAGNEGHLTNEKIQFLKNAYNTVEVIFIGEPMSLTIHRVKQGDN